MTLDWSTYTSWDLVLPPNRPSEELLQVIYLTLSVAANTKSVCILGSTPEYRSLCYKLSIPEVVIIDKSEVFSGQCDNYTIKSFREVKIYDDWITALPQFVNRFDIILSHLTHGNIPFERRRKFFEVVRKSLKPAGLLIDYVFQPNAPGYSLEQIVHLFQDRCANIRTYNDFNSVALFQSDRIASHKRVDTSAIYSFLETSPIPETVRLIVAGTKKVTPPGYIWYYNFDTSPATFGFFEGYDILVELSEPPASPFFNAANLYVLRKTT